jgi:hypothetical protein
MPTRNFQGSTTVGTDGHGLSEEANATSRNATSETTEFDLGEVEDVVD